MNTTCGLTQEDEVSFEDAIARLHYLNKEILTIFQDSQAKFQGLVYISSLEIKDNMMLLELKKSSENDIFELNFKANFKDVENIFNETFPSDKYFDLGPIINKYELLNPKKKTKEIISSFSVCLETCLSQLQDKLKLTSSCLNSYSNFKEILDLNDFQMFTPTASYQLTPIQRTNNTKLKYLNIKVDFDKFLDETFLLFLRFLKESFSFKFINFDPKSVVNLGLNEAKLFYPTNPGPEGNSARGYQIIFKRNPLITGVIFNGNNNGEIIAYVISKDNKVKYKASVSCNNLNLSDKTIYIPFFYKWDNNDSAIMVSKSDNGNYSYSQGNNSPRTVNNDLEVTSKISYFKPLNNEKVYLGQNATIDNNTYSIDIGLLYYFE